MQTLTIQGREYLTARDAVVAGKIAISIGDRFFRIDEAEYRRLQDEGIQPTTWHLHRPTGRLMSVPGKH